jgi:hypothetical protein
VNQYEAIAQQHWRPTSYAAIADPRTSFTGLGQQAADAVLAK